jgi:protein O-GlcNAc transferase
MNEPTDLYRIAVGHHREGRMKDAETTYRAVLALAPDHADALHMLGIVLAAGGRESAAVESIGRALEIQPVNADFINNYGVLCRKLNRMKEAISAYRAALAHNPDYTDAAYNLANILADTGQGEESISLYLDILSRDPANGRARTNLGGAYQRNGRLDEAVAQFEYLVAAEPENAAHRANLGVALFQQGDEAAAIACYEEALQIDPQSSEALGNLGLALMELGRFEAAGTRLRAAAVLAPDNADILSNLATLHRREGRVDEATQAYRTAIAIRPSGGLKVRLATLLPVIPRSLGDMARARDQFEDEITRLARDGVEITDPFREAGVTQFHLSYHDANNHALASKVANLYLDSCPDLGTTAISGVKNRDTGNRRIKVGFVSRYFRNHAVGWCYHGMLRFMPRERISVSAFTFGSGQDPLWDAISADVDAAISLPLDLPRARAAIAAAGMDVLVYTDIGMEPLTYFLSFARLAPVQCVTNGHPDTTGVPALDYFISGSPLAPPNAGAQYSETLVNLDGALAYYDRPAFPQNLATRARFGLPEDAALYLCPQSLFKIHPEMDSWFANILRRNDKAVLALFEGASPEWTRILRARWASLFGDAMSRVLFLPRMPLPEFLNVLSLADVILDTWPFGGGNTAYQAFAAGVPVVTLPSDYVRGRSTMALYHQMGVGDAIAENPEEYVDIATRLGRDQRIRRELSQEISAASEILFCDIGTIHAFEDFLATVQPKSNLNE